MNTELLSKYDNQSFSKFCVPAQIERDLQTLSGLITGISCDREINPLERKGLADWMENIKSYGKADPYRSILTALTNALDDNILTKDEADDIVWLCNMYIEKTNYYDAVTQGIQKLHGITEGIIIDEKINEEELGFLEQWMDENTYLKNCWPYDEIYSFLTKVMSDRKISPDEHKELIEFCGEIVSSNNNASNNGLLSVIKAGYCQIEPEIILQERTFCITGNSSRYTQKEIAEKIELFGGYVTKSISKNLNYLIVCDEKSKCWAYTCYGRKIEKVVHLRKDGHKVAIVHENDLHDVLAGMQ